MKFTEPEILAKLENLPGWKYNDNEIGKDYTFSDFVAAFAFLTKVALLSERAGHHPDWSGGYNKVSIRLTTHDKGGVTEKDFNLAGEIDG
jgi:4a-hydroxytetrahydrobiopterin dehydratase